MKKTFTPELIDTIIKATFRLIESSGINSSDVEKLLKAASGEKFEEEVEGVKLIVSVREDGSIGFNGCQRKTASVVYGKMVIVHGMDISLLSPNASNMLRIILTSVLGKNSERLDMNQLAAMISKQTVVRAMNSGSGLGYLSVGSSTDFKVELPGDVVLARLEKSVSVTKKGECIYTVLSTIPHVIEQHLNQAASLALGHADELVYPARTVDLSVESAILNGVLYIKTGDKSIGYYFDDERTKSFVARQHGQHFGQGIISDPNQQFGRPLGNLQPGLHNRY